MENKFFRLQRIKTQLKRFIPIPFILAALFLFVLNTQKYPALEGFKLKVMDSFSPIIYVISVPFSYIFQKADDVSDYLNVYKENKRLKEENKILVSWRNAALKLASDQKELAKLLNYVPVTQGREYVVRILADYNSPFTQSVVLNGGRNIGVQKGDVLVTNNGLYGHVIEVGKKTSRALKLTDYFSRLPVLVGDNRILCILTGDNTTLPKLISLPEDAVIQKGDLVMSAGDAGVYPSGIAIGRISAVESGEISVQPFENTPNPEFIRVIHFGLGGLILDDDDTCQDNKR